MSKATGPDRLLLERITDALKSEGQFTLAFDEHESEAIEKVRSLGRRAGRELGWKVRTFASDPCRRDDRRIVVIVAVEESTPLHQELMRVRGDKAIRAAMSSWSQRLKLGE